MLCWFIMNVFLYFVFFVSQSLNGRIYLQFDILQLTKSIFFTPVAEIWNQKTTGIKYDNLMHYSVE